MKNVLFVIDSLNEGAGRVVYDIVKNIDKKEFTPIITSIYKGGNMDDVFQKLKVRLIYLKKQSSHLDTILRLKNIIKKEKIDIVNTHNVDAYEYGVLAAWLAGTKVIHVAHGKSVKRGNLRRARENLYHKFISLFLKRYITVSNDLGRYAAKNWVLNKNKISTIYNGIDTDKFKKTKTNKSFLKRFNVKNNDLLIGIIAGLRPVKNHRALIKSMLIIKKRVPDAKLLIIGDGPEKQRLIKLTKSLRLEKDIIFLGHRTDIPKILNVIDINVLSSFSECLSITLLESMACSLPSVATAVGGNPEVIENNRTGFLVPSNDSGILADRIIKLLKDKKLRKTMGKNARERVTKKFSIDTMIGIYRRIFSK